MSNYTKLAAIVVAALIVGIGLAFGIRWGTAPRTENGYAACVALVNTGYGSGSIPYSLVPAAMANCAKTPPVFPGGPTP